MVDQRDPHFALGMEHAGHGWMPYAWSDPEHQRRYDLGYQQVARCRIESEWNRMAQGERNVYRQLQRLQGVKDPLDDD